MYAFPGRKQALEKDPVPPPTHTHTPFFTWSGLTELNKLIKSTLDHHNITQSMLNFRDVCLSSYEP